MVKLKTFKNFSNIAFFILIYLSKSFSYENLFVSTDNRDIYNYLNVSKNQHLTVTGIKPFTCEKVSIIQDYEKNDLCSDFKLLNDVSFISFYSNSKNAFSIIPEIEGLKLNNGINSILQIGGGLDLKDKIIFNYQLRYNQNDNSSKTELYRIGVNVYLNNLIFTVGKDNIKIGPSKYGNLFSSTNPPFYQFNIRNNKPLEFYGLWDFILMYGYLKESRRDHSNPNLVFFRGDYKPNKYIEIGVNRAVLFGGEGRPSYKIYEYPKVFYGSEETTGGKFDNDSYLGYDIKLDIPIKYFDSFQIYYENNATDVESPLKKGDPKKLHFPLIIFKFHDNASTLGIRLKKNMFYFNSEFTQTGKTMYINHNYPYEDWSYKGFILGYPYGRSIEHFFTEFGILKKDSHNLIELGYIRQPTDISSDIRVKDYYIKFNTYKLINKVGVNLYIKYDYFNNLNKSELANQFNLIKANKSVITLGIFFKYKF